MNERILQEKNINEKCFVECLHNPKTLTNINNMPLCHYLWQRGTLENTTLTCHVISLN